MKKTSAFSLIEVLIFVSILSIFFIVATTVTIASLRNMKISEHKILATHYAEELAEWLRDQKEADWTNFSVKNGKYCFSESIISDWPVSLGACGTSDYLENIFKREVTLSSVTGNPVTQVNIGISVSWTELGNEYEVPLTTVFTRWED